MQGGQLGKRPVTANRPRDRHRTFNTSTYNRKQRNFTCSVVLMHQQNQRQERDRQTGKSHVKTRTFIFCLVDVRVAQFLISCEIQMKNITFKPGIAVVHTFKSGTLQAERWESKARLTYKASSAPARATSETLFQNRQTKCQKERILQILKNDIHEC